MWIHWWSPVASANRSMCRWSIATHELVPSSRASARSSSAIVSRVATSLLSFGQRPQRLAVDLADRRQRDLRQDLDLAGVLVAAEALLRVGDELGLVGVEPRSQLDERDDLLPVRLVGPADDAGRRDGGMLEQRVLDVAREHVEAAADDQVLHAVDDEEIAVIVDVAHVARVQPVAARRIGS